MATELNDVAQEKLKSFASDIGKMTGGPDAVGKITMAFILPSGAGGFDDETKNKITTALNDNPDEALNNAREAINADPELLKRISRDPSALLPAMEKAEAPAVSAPAPTVAAVPTSAGPALAGPSPELTKFIGQLQDPNNAPLKQAFEDIFGQGGQNLSPAEQIKELQKLEAQDPTFFKKLNEVIDRPDFDKFLVKAGEHEELRDMLADTLGTSGSNPEEASQFLNGLHKAAMGDEKFFTTTNRLIDEHPQQIGNIIREIRNDPNGDFASMSMFTQLAGGMHSMIDVVGGPNSQFGGMLQGLMNTLMEMMPQLQKMLAPFMGMIDKLGLNAQQNGTDPRAQGTGANLAAGLDDRLKTAIDARKPGDNVIIKPDNSIEITPTLS
ncbi:MAG: hypothetical protein H6868_02600 [Rhodospirillales bacterium]|nr:hypothetical protein [Rhodospirillales bacterium]